MTTAAMLTGTCRCGASVERERVVGFGAFANEWPFVCPPCAADDVQRYETENADQEQRDHAQAIRRRIERLPKALRERRLIDLDATGCGNVIAAAARWARGDLPGLGLVGNFGTGKTTILAAAGVDASHAGRTIRWVSAPLALSLIGRSFGDSDREAMLEKLTSTRGALVLDDIDKVRPNAHGAELVFSAIDTAITEGLPLAFTANQKPSQLSTYWPKPHGEAIASRLAGYCETFQLTGADRRLRRAGA